MRGTAAALPAAAGLLAALLVWALGATLVEPGAWARLFAARPGPTVAAAADLASMVALALASAAAWLSWWAAPDHRHARLLVGLYASGGFWLLAWSVLLFRFGRPDLALLAVAPVWFVLVALVLLTRRFAPWAAALLVPCLAWMAAAAVLTLELLPPTGAGG
ncbi:MAG: tryptophan-rich sensory protein [Sphingomonadaceae bacterium]|nr:tryptophan-rich sensory protein [Sphingomonadaceae bacterium]